MEPRALCILVVILNSVWIIDTDSIFQSHRYYFRAFKLGRWVSAETETLIS
jgi:hypothetical protein